MNQGGITILSSLVPNFRCKGRFVLSKSSARLVCLIHFGGENLSNIKYNEKEEAFELPYKIWGEPKLVRFYAEDEQSIMDNLKDIAGKLAKLDGSRKKLAELIIDDGHFDYAEPDALADTLELSNIYVDIDEDDTVVCFCVSSDDYNTDGKKLSIELYGSDFEIIGWR